MIPRYSPKDVAALFSDEHRFDTMLEVELLCAEALAVSGVLPAEEVAVLRQRRPVIDRAFVADVEEREEEGRRRNGQPCAGDDLHDGVRFQINAGPADHRNQDHER